MPPASSFSDEDWTARVLQGLREGDREAARNLQERYGPPLLGHARRLVCRLDLPGLASEDIVQETWLSAFEHRAIPRFKRRHPGSLFSWLRIIQSRKCLDHLRKARALRGEASVSQRSLDKASGGETLGQQVPSSDTTPTSRARYQEYLALCKRTLTEREWEAWRMVEIEDRTDTEAAPLLGTTPSAVRSLVHRSKLKLLKELDEDSEEH